MVKLLTQKFDTYLCFYYLQVAIIKIINTICITFFFSETYLSRYADRNAFFVTVDESSKDVSVHDSSDFPSMESRPRTLSVAAKTLFSTSIRKNSCHVLNVFFISSTRSRLFVRFRSANIVHLSSSDQLLLVKLVKII